MAHKIALLYGFGEGAWHGAKFKKGLQGADVEMVVNTKDADIVIAHSAGVFYVPELHDNQTIMLINPTYWPEQNPLAQMIAKIWLDCQYNAFRHPWYLIQKTFWNVIYIVKDLADAREIIKLSKQFDLISVISHHKTIIVRNHADTWLTSDLNKLKAANPSLRIHHVSGEHDDCWLHPETYINLLQSDVEADKL